MKYVLLGTKSGITFTFYIKDLADVYQQAYGGNIIDLSVVSDREDLQYSAEYADFIMSNGSGDRVICNGDTLLEAQEDGYLFDEFLSSLDQTQ